jgi:hypothetical protein
MPTKKGGKIKKWENMVKRIRNKKRRVGNIFYPKNKEN